MQTVKPDIIKTVKAVLSDMEAFSPVSPRQLRLDAEYLEKRYKHEGEGLVTKTLPSFGKHFDTCLLNEVYVPTSLLPRKKGSILPRIFHGLMTLVFDNQGKLLCNPNTAVIAGIRQVCFMFYKLERDYTEETVDEFIKSFVEVDASLTSCDAISLDQASCVYHAQALIEDWFKEFDPEEISPRPGPGQCSTKEEHYTRYEPQRKYEALHRVYPYYRYYYIDSHHLLDRVRKYRSLPVHLESHSRLSFVPKDSRGPRVICMEPPEFMWLQQGLGRSLMDHVEAHPISRGHVNFRDQSKNGELALKGSSNGQWATLDMKEASDRISTALVDVLFDGVPRLRDRLLALSTDYIDLPQGQSLRKKKFAPMGSALCFPVMSIVHYALAYGSLRTAGWSHRKCLRSVYVYGDDIITSIDAVAHLFEDFPKFDLRFNESKSCYTGRFRESCGVDAYAGVNVTPCRIKSDSFHKQDPSLLVSHLAYYHNLLEKGYRNAARSWRSLIDVVWRNLPYVSKGSPVIGYLADPSRLTVLNAGCRTRWNPNTQTYERKGMLLKSVPYASMIGGWERLMRATLHVQEGSSASLMKRSRVKVTRKWLSISHW